MKKESAIPINHLFKPRRLPILNDALKAFDTIFYHGPFPHYFSGFNYQLHIRNPLKLMVNVEDFVFQVNITQSLSAEL